MQINILKRQTKKILKNKIIWMSKIVQQKANNMPINQYSLISKIMDWIKMEKVHASELHNKYLLKKQNFPQS